MDKQDVIAELMLRKQKLDQQIAADREEKLKVK